MNKASGKRAAWRATRMGMLAAASAIVLSATVSMSALADQGRSQDYYKDALEWLQKGDGRAALIQLRNAVKEDPDNFNARLLLGRLYLETGNLPSALKELEVAHKGAPGDETEVYYGRALLAGRQYQKVLDTVQQTANDPTFGTVKVLIRSEALFGLGRLDDAMAEVQPILAKDSNQPQANLMAARILAAQNDPKAAYAHVDAALVGNPKLMEAYLVRANLDYAARDMDKAMESLDRAIELAPDDPRPKMLKAETLMRLGRLDEATTLVKAYQEKNPRDVRAAYLMARILAAEGKYEEADQELRPISEAVRQIPAASLLAGIVKYHLEQYAQAEEALQRYVQTAGDEARQARRLIAAIQLRTLRPRAVLGTLQSLIGEGSRDVASMQMAASAYLRVNDLQNAKAMFARVVRYGAPADVRQAQPFLQVLDSAKPDVDGKLTLDPLVKDTLVVLDLMRTGEEAEALKDALKLAEANPDNNSVANLVAGIYVARNDLETARKYLTPALERDPNAITLMRTMDRIDTAEGKFDAVEKRARDALAASPDNEQIILHLAQFLAQRGRRDEAVRLLEEKADALPQSLALRQTLARLDLALKRPDDARKRANEALAIGKAGTVQGLVLAGDIFVALKDLPAAEEAFGQLASATNQSTGALLKLAQVQFQAGDTKATRATLEQVLAKDPANAVANRSLVSLYLRDGDGDAAMAAADRAAKANDILGLQLRAEVYRQTKRMDQAILEMRNGLAKHKISELAQQTFRLLVEAGKVDEAKKLLSGWLVDHPDDPDSLQLLSALLIREQDYGGAAVYLERAFSLLPNNPVVLNNLAWVRYELQRPGALAVARRAYRLAPQAPAVIDTLGWILVREGELDEGVKLLYTANDAAPKVGDIAYHLAFALEKSGKKTDAIGVLERALDPATDAEFGEDRTKAEELLAKLKAG
ncbi:MAG: PEP-CTERM system TPR-repeat protein PrsT [Alphaproteobacteria bacterium]|nr:PEP-CTERM system TPR-repeat protein PrsT [Alphaproteobacteria bacterium]MCB9929122.1 PEP-CTERM system TPR-repeat protein PrsT [Alphaproteobacteria bacterium]